MPAKSATEKGASKPAPSTPAATSKSTAPVTPKGIVEVKAFLVNEDTGAPSNQCILIVLPLSNDGKRISKSCERVFGYLDEFEGEKKCRYPYVGEVSKKEAKAVLDMGCGLEDLEFSEGKNESITSPAGYRFFTLVFHDEISLEKLVTLTGGPEERDLYKISAITEYK